MQDKTLDMFAILIMSEAFLNDSIAFVLGWFVFLVRHCYRFVCGVGTIALKHDDVLTEGAFICKTRRQHNHLVINYRNLCIFFQEKSRWNKFHIYNSVYNHPHIDSTEIHELQILW